MFSKLSRIEDGKTGRESSWDISGRNADSWDIKPGESRVLADIKGPGKITHIWMTQLNHYRECLIKITWDNAEYPSVLCPLGDFFGLGNGISASYESYLFSSSTRIANLFNTGCSFNSYVPMPFKERAVVEIINESKEDHTQYFYIDYETGADIVDKKDGYFHCEFRRTNPFQGWGPEMSSNKPGCHLSNSFANKERQAWDNNYVILETKGRGHYLGCNVSVTNFQADWWGEGDDMIWVDGYKWPPDIHGTGSEDYFNQAWGMQDNAFMRNGSSVFEGNTTLEKSKVPWDEGGYQTSYIHHLENPVRFQKEIKVTMEHGHGNHLANEMASVAYWYLDKPSKVIKPPSISKRMPVLRDNAGNWLYDKKNQCPGPVVEITPEMEKLKDLWKKEYEK